MCLFSASWLLDLKSGSWGFPECLGSPLQRYFVKCVNTAVCTRTQGGQSQGGDIRGLIGHYRQTEVPGALHIELPLAL
jgi:hypothetical protein